MDIGLNRNNSDMFLKAVPVFHSFLGDLAAKIANYNFEWRYNTVIMFNALHVYGLHSFFKYYDRSLIVKFGLYAPRNRFQVPQFVIFGQSSSEIVTTLRWMNILKYDLNGKYIIVCPFSDFITCDERQIFQYLSKLYILNVVVLKKSENNKKPLVFSYEIVIPGKCIHSEPVRLDWVYDCKNRTCFQSIFHEKLTNFYMCPLYVSTLEQPPFMYLNRNTSNPSGADGEVIKLVAHVINATLIMQTPADGAEWGTYTNDNWTGSLGDVFNSRAHASMCLTPLTSHKYGNFQISFTYYSMDMVWAARLPGLEPSWEKILYPLKIDLRVILLFTFFCIVLLNTFTKLNVWRKIRRAFNIVAIKHNLPFYSWVLFLGMPMERMPTRAAFRILISTWIWFCFVIRSAYQAALICSLKHPAYKDSLQTWNDIIRHPYGGVSSLREYYTNDPEIYDNWKLVEHADTIKILDDILDGSSNFVLALNKDILKNYVMKHNGTKQLQIVPQKIVTSPTVIYFKKFSLLTAPINKILIAAFEAGFIEHFYKKFLMQESEFYKNIISYSPESLKMEHFSGCFVILIIGYCLSFIYFIVEVVCGNLDKIK